MIKFLKLILNGKHAGVPLRHSNAKQYALFCKKLSVVKSRISKLGLFFEIHSSLKWNRRRNISTNNSTLRRSPWLCNKRVLLLFGPRLRFRGFRGIDVFRWPKKCVRAPTIQKRLEYSANLQSYVFALFWRIMFKLVDDLISMPSLKCRWIFA